MLKYAFKPPNQSYNQSSFHTCFLFFRIDSQEIQECCQSTLQSFNQCMFYEPVVYCDDSSEENLQFMEDDVVFKIVVICMVTIYILQKKGRIYFVMLFSGVIYSIQALVALSVAKWAVNPVFVSLYPGLANILFRHVCDNSQCDTCHTEFDPRS